MSLSILPYLAPTRSQPSSCVGRGSPGSRIGLAAIRRTNTLAVGQLATFKPFTRFKSFRGRLTRSSGSHENRASGRCPSFNFACTTASLPNSARKRASARLAASRSRVGRSTKRRSCSVVAAHPFALSSISMTPAENLGLQTQTNQIEDLDGIECRRCRADLFPQPVASIDKKREPQRRKCLGTRGDSRQHRMEQLLDEKK